MTRPHGVAAIVEDASHQQRLGTHPCLDVVRELLGKSGLHGVEEATVENRQLLSWEDLALKLDLADVEPIAQQVGEGTSGEGDAADDLSRTLDAPLRGDPLPPEIRQQRTNASEFEVAPEDRTDGLGLCLIHRDLAVFGIITEWGHATDPEPLALGRSNLVPDPLRRHLPLELCE